MNSGQKKFKRKGRICRWHVSTSHSVSRTKRWDEITLDLPMFKVWGRQWLTGITWRTATKTTSGRKGEATTCIFFLFPVLLSFLFILPLSTCEREKKENYPRLMTGCSGRRLESVGLNDLKRIPKKFRIFWLSFRPQHPPPTLWTDCRLTPDDDQLYGKGDMRSSRNDSLLHQPENPAAIPPLHPWRLHPRNKHCIPTHEH